MKFDTGYGIRVTGCALRVARCGLRVAGYGVRVFRFRISDFRFGIEKMASMSCGGLDLEFWTRPGMVFGAERM